MSAHTLPVYYDPAQDGANCPACPLRPGGPLARAPWRPIRSEHNRNAIALAIGLCPGDDETTIGVPFVGKAGVELTENMRAVGLARVNFSYTNLLACQPPGVATGAHERMMGRLARHNKTEAERHKADPDYTPDTWADPVACCAPRLFREARAYDNLILLGSVATKVFYGERASITELRGGHETIHALATGDLLRGNVGTLGVVKTWKVLPTWHPSHVLQVRRWRGVARRDLAKAVRWFTGKLRWEPPHKLIRPSPSQVEDFFRHPHSYVVYDLETTIASHPGTGRLLNYAEPLRVDLRVTAFGHRGLALVVPHLSIDGHTRFYSAPDEAWIRQILKERLFANPAIVKVGHNNIQFDGPVVERFYGVNPSPVLDGIFLHRLAESEFPHGLGYIASVYTDSPAWKADHTATSAGSDFELHNYAGDDVAVTDETAQLTYAAVQARGQAHLVAHDQAMAAVCVGLHKNGLRVNQEVAANLMREFTADHHTWMSRCRAISGLPNLNPNSDTQVRDLLFEQWELPVQLRTEVNEDPSVAVESLVQLFLEPSLEPDQRAFLHALRKCRKAVKKMSFVRSYGLWGSGGQTWDDGRIRSSYKAHVTPSGRLASGDPLNLQNQPIPLRVVFEPQPGFCYIVCDKDQVELRGAAGIAHAERYLKVFAEGLDPHSMLAEMAWGDLFTNAEGTKKSGMKGRMRDLAKRICYASLYGAAVETIHEQILQVEDGEERLIYYDYALSETSRVYEAWMAFAPEFAKWWERVVQTWRRQGFVADPVGGRRRDSLDSAVGDEEMNELVNHVVQSAIAHDVNLSCIDLVREIPFEKWGPGTGLVAHTHDELLFEVPDDQALHYKDLVTEGLTTRREGIPGVVLTAEASIQYAWTARKCSTCKRHTDARMVRWHPETKLCRC